MSVSVEGQPIDPYVDKIAPGKERMRYEMRGDEVMDTGATDKPQPQVGGVAQAGQVCDEYEGDGRGWQDAV